MSTIRGATPPSRNGLSHANRERSPQMAEKLFWRVLDQLKKQTPGFAGGKRRGQAFRFKMPIHIMDSTTIELVANSLDWAKHRRRKAAAKTHLRLNLQSLLPEFVIVDTAAEHDNLRGRELCAGLKSGEIALFDKGYVDFGHLRDLDGRGVFWVIQANKTERQQRVTAIGRQKVFFIFEKRRHSNQLFSDNDVFEKACARIKFLTGPASRFMISRSS